MSLPALAIRRPVAVAMVFAAVVFLGLISFVRLPIDLLPDIAYPRLVVHTGYAGVGPAEVERFVTEPVEQVVSSVPGVRGVESVSREGVSLVTIRFAWGTDMDFAALNVRERLDNLRERLPELADRPLVLRTDPGSEPILAVAVTGERGLWSLKDLADNVVRRRLEQVDGVAQAAVTGGLEREIQVLVDAAALESHGLTLDDVSTALDAANASAPGGTVRRGRYRYALRTLGELTTVEQVAAVVLPSEGPATVTVADVATVVDGFEERESIARHAGREAVGLVVFKESGANTVQVAERVDEVLDQLRGEFPGIGMTVASSQATFVSGAIDNVVLALLQGAVLAFLVLFLFLRDARYPVAIGLAIPVSVVATFGLLHAAGISLNVMTLGGLALGVGMLVDNSIVVLENSFRHRELGVEPGAAARLGAEEVRGAITASTLTTIAVFGPIVYVQGVAGELLADLSLAVAFSLLASLVVALTLLPALAARWRGDALPAERRSGLLARPLAAFDRRFEAFADRYEATLARALDRPGRVAGIAIALFAVAVVIGAGLDRDVLPDVDQREFRIALTLPRGTPLERTADVAGSVEDALRRDGDVTAVFTRVGRQAAVQGIDAEETGLHTAALDVRVRSGAATADVVERLEPTLSAIPGEAAVETGRATALGRLLGGGEADLAVRVVGEELEPALAHAEALRARLAALPELTNVRVGTELGQPEVRIEIDRERAAAYGIEPRRIAETITGLMQGRVATDLVDFDRRVPVVVRLPDADRHSLATLETLRVDGVPLRELVRTTEAVGPVEIRREDQAREVSVLADVATGGVAAATEAIERVTRELPPPRGMRVSIGGENEELREGLRELGFAFALALLLVFMILAAEFESVVLPLVILGTVPLALVGAIVALWLAGAGINSLSLIGIIVLVGIVDNDAVVKIDFIQQLRARGLSVREAVLAAGRARLRPIVMTTATTLLGVLPMALGLGLGGELQRPLAVAVFGGLFTATALTLIVIPVAFEAAVRFQDRLLGRPAAARARSPDGAAGSVRARADGGPGGAGREAAEGAAAVPERL